MYLAMRESASKNADLNAKETRSSLGISFGLLHIVAKSEDREGVDEGGSNLLIAWALASATEDMLKSGTFEAFWGEGSDGRRENHLLFLSFESFLGPGVAGIGAGAGGRMQSFRKMLV